MTYVGMPRPYGTGDTATLLLFQRGQERQTGLTVVTVTLDHIPIPGTLLLFKNGTLLDEVAGAGGFSISGKVITLGTAAIAGDVFRAHYHWRQ